MARACASIEHDSSSPADARASQPMLVAMSVVRHRRAVRVAEPAVRLRVSVRPGDRSPHADAARMRRELPGCGAGDDGRPHRGYRRSAAGGAAAPTCACAARRSRRWRRVAQSCYVSRPRTASGLAPDARRPNALQWEPAAAERRRGLHCEQRTCPSRRGRPKRPSRALASAGRTR